ncbi:Uncharacterized protein APZ42_001449, partial [Daphnia magna]
DPVWVVARRTDDSCANWRPESCVVVRFVAAVSTNCISTVLLTQKQNKRQTLK